MRDAKLISSNIKIQNEALFEMLNSAAQLDMADFFIYKVSGPVMDLDAAPYGGARFKIEVELDLRKFESFDLDIGIGDVVIEPLDWVLGISTAIACHYCHPK